MITLPTMYQEGQVEDDFTGTIIKIAGIPLQGSISKKLSEGEIYKTINKKVSITESFDEFDNTYLKTTVNIEFKNAEYRPDSTGIDGDYLRVSDDLTGDIVGADARVYYINNRNATSLDDCACKFVGSVQSISDYDEKTISVSLIFKGKVCDAKILTSAASGSMGRLIGDGVPVPNKQLQVPKVYGDYTFGLTGLAMGLRTDRNDLNYTFSDHRLKTGSVGSLYFSHGKTASPGKDENSVFTAYAPNKPYNFLTFGAVKGVNIPYTFVDFKVSTEPLRADFGERNVWFQASAHWAGETIPELKGQYAVENQTFVKGQFYGAAPNRTVGRVAWDLLNPDDIKAQMAQTASTVSGIYAYFANFQGSGAPTRALDDATGGTWRKWLFWFASLDTLGGVRGNFVEMKETGDPGYPWQADTGANPSRWYASEKILPGSKGMGELRQFGRDFALGYEIIVHNDYILAPDAVAKFGAVILRMEFDESLILDENDEGALIAYAPLQGLVYGSWITTFTNAFNGTTGGTPTPGRLIDTGAGIITSLLIDRLPGEASLSASAEDFDLESFGHNLFNGHTMRINVIEDDATINTIATELGLQSPWTFCFTAAGRAKFVSTRTVFKNDIINATIKYEDLKNGALKVGLTAKTHIRNYAIVKSRYFGERDHYMDEVIVENKSSQAQYGVRKGTYEWKNICSEQQQEQDSTTTPNTGGDNGSTTGIVGGQNFGASVNSGLRVYNTRRNPIIINNPVTYMNEYLFSSLLHADRGLLSHQHHKLSKMILKGTKYHALEIGDVIAIDNTEFAPRNITVFKESFTGKRWLITDITSTEDSVTINRAVQLRSRRLLSLPIGDEI